MSDLYPQSADLFGAIPGTAPRPLMTSA
jgi:hypothetical protein